MAGRPKKITTENVEKKTKKEIEFEKKISELEQKINNLANQPKVATVTTYEAPKREQAPYREFIEVMSLTNHRLSLTTETHGGGRPYNFSRFGEIQSIVYDDLALIINNNRNFITQGACKILDDRIIRLHGLIGDYQKILDKDVIENILTYDKGQIKTIYESTTKRIQNTIVSIIIEKLTKGEEVDLNKLKVISDLYGKDINSMVGGSKENQEE